MAACGLATFVFGCVTLAIMRHGNDHTSEAPSGLPEKQVFHTGKAGAPPKMQS